MKARGSIKRFFKGPYKKISLLSICTVFGIWFIIGEFKLVSPYFVPSIQSVLGAAITSWNMGVLQRHITASLFRVLVGFSVGASLAIGVGLLMGWYRKIEAMIDPIYQFVRAIPPLAYVPLAIVWLGIGEEFKIFVIGFAAFCITLISVISGVKHTPEIYINAAKTLGAHNKAIFFKVVIPSATPYILSGIRIALAVSWGVMVAAEFVAATTGIGFMIIMSKNLLRTDLVILGIIIIGLLVLIMDRIIKMVETHATAWMESVKE